MLDNRIYLDFQERRLAIRRGWETYQAVGWKGKSAYDVQDDRWWFWMNGVEAAEKARRGYTIRMEDVDGWN